MEANLRFIHIQVRYTKYIFGFKIMGLSQEGIVGLTTITDLLKRSTSKCDMRGQRVKLP